MKRLAGVIAALALLGAGCLPVLPAPSSEKTAASVEAKAGLRLTLNESAFGFGGVFLETIGQSTARRLTVERWDGKNATVSWEKSFDRETDASKKAREEFEKLPPTPVGKPANVAPKRETETVIVKGTVATNALEGGSSLLLPAVWTEGDQSAQKGRTLIWLSAEQYRQLTETRKAKVDLGLFDTDLAGALSAVQGFQAFLDWANHKPADPSSQQAPLDLMNADEDWGSYPVKIDGETQTVRTIEAGNAFARISVLANPQNPLVLQVRLTPAAYGPTVLIAPGLTFQKALGYEVTEIKTAP